MVTTADNGFKILANADGLRTLRAYEARSYEARSYEASKASIDMKVCYNPLVMSLFVQSFLTGVLMLVLFRYQLPQWFQA